MKGTDVILSLNNGVKIPAMGLGTVAPEDSRAKMVDNVVEAIKIGYRHIDTAWCYGIEDLVGKALQRAFKEGIVKREDMFVTTKVWPTMYDKVEQSLDVSLKSLQLDYVDLFLQHWPLCMKSGEDGYPTEPKDSNGNWLYDEKADYLDTYKTMIDIYQNTNKVRAIGVCNYTVPLMERLLKETSVVPAVNQVELHPQLAQRDLVQFCESHGILMESYSPLGSGGAPVLKLPQAIEIAKKHNVTASEILLSYHVSAGRIVLPRSHNPKRLAQNTIVVELTKEELDALDKVENESPKRYIQCAWSKVIGYSHWTDN